MEYVGGWALRYNTRREHEKQTSYIWMESHLLRGWPGGRVFLFCFIFLLHIFSHPSLFSTMSNRNSLVLQGHKKYPGCRFSIQKLPEKRKKKRKTNSLIQALWPKVSNSKSEILLLNACWLRKQAKIWMTFKWQQTDTEKFYFSSLVGGGEDTAILHLLEIHESIFNYWPAVL